MGSDGQQVLAIPGDDQLGARGDGHSDVFFCSVTLDASVMRRPQSATMNLQTADFKVAFQGTLTGGAFGYVGGYVGRGYFRQLRWPRARRLRQRRDEWRRG
jgi:hypothetical protein